MSRTMLRTLCAPLLLAACAAFAQAPNNESEQKAAIEAADKVKVEGPASVALRDQGTLKLPAGYVYVPVPAAAQLLQAMGNRTDERLVGVIAPSGPDNWFVVIRFVKDGYVKDDDAKDWNANDLLKSL